MATQIRFKPSRIQQRLKRMDRSSEAERKKLFAISHFLEVQEERQPRPFPNTALGKLPPELRVMIYQHLLVIPQFQADRDDDIKNAKDSSNVSQPFIHLKKSSLSILRTCRQIKHEAHRILLQSGIPYFANASELLSFLTGTGSTGRSRLEAIRIGPLVFPEPFADRKRPPKSCWFFFGSGDGISCRYGRKDPDTIGAFSLLMECESLRTIYMDMKQSEEFRLFIMIRTFMCELHQNLHFRELHDWFIHRPGLPEPPIFRTLDGSLANKWRTLIFSGKLMERDVLVKVNIHPLSAPKPFSATCLGKLPSCSMPASRPTR